MPILLLLQRLRTISLILTISYTPPMITFQLLFRLFLTDILGIISCCTALIIPLQLIMSTIRLDQRI
jgi:hypothetical protein